MPLNKTLSDKILRPKDFKDWTEEVATYAATSKNSSARADRLEGFTQQGTDHHILPANEIRKLLQNALNATADNVLTSAVAHAGTNRLIATELNGNEIDIDLQLGFLIERIMWCTGNVIPGLPSQKRLDDPMHDGGMEEPLAVTTAHTFATGLGTRLTTITTTPNLDNWKALINHIDPEQPSCLAARNDTLAWADAWATHPTYTIYVRLNQAETEAFRKAQPRENYTRKGIYAWIDVNGTHTRLKTIGDILATFEQEIINLPPKEKATKEVAMVAKIKLDTKGQNFQRFWLEKHSPSTQP